MAGSPPTSLTLRHWELARLAQGYAYIFWGTLVLVASAMEALLTPLRLWHLAASAVGMACTVYGAWALTRVTVLGADWQRHTRDLLWAGVVVAYLTPFAWLWRQVPASRYLLTHTLAWVGGLLIFLVVVNASLRVLGRAAGDRGLAWQAIASGALLYALLAGPFVWLVYSVVEGLGAGSEPWAILQAMLPQLHWLAVFALLAPVSLTLSLAWTAKDWALRRLTQPVEDTILSNQTHE